MVTPILSDIAVAQSARSAMLTTRSPNSRIKVRSAPTVEAQLVSYGWTGDAVKVLGEAQGQDGYIWYYVRFDTSGIEGWIRGDLVSIAVSGSPLTTSSSNFSQSPASFTSNPAPKAVSTYQSEVINYFLEIAMGSEYGESTSVIRKWSGPIRIKIYGSPTLEDRRTLETVIREVNNLISGVYLELTDSNANVQIYFVPESQFRRYEPNYQPVNYGFFWTSIQGNVIQKARIMITTTGVTQKERSHLIREELTQALGLMKDSYRYRDSIFYQGWTDPTEYSAIDRTLIQMLYHPEIRPGLNKAQVLKTLMELNQTASKNNPL
ncbi:DUF2927 domain-containing protein [Leptolyngbya sp. 'hensonii']|uniref:DUF2927 domain-containing protein n=1 Tax=Leptolyngbya sp. 'hensonii' TaxID=1922337 RepID=UPI00209B08BB|nr:DUF2927 domain-containing protein [Leptolyngbya sp. 'hensonii']